jgi:hypothetical protein
MNNKYTLAYSAENKGPFVNLKMKRKASDGTFIVPVHYTYLNCSSFVRYGWYEIDSLRGNNLPCLHNPDGIAYMRFLMEKSYMSFDQKTDRFKMNMHNIIQDISYYVNNKLHRKDGPAIIQRCNKTEIWYKNNKQHRIGGPSYIAEKEKIWKADDKFHRVNGPAVQTINLKKTKKFYYFMGSLIPDHIVRFEEGCSTKPLDRTAILEAVLWNRNYGKIIDIIYKTNAILSEHEVYKIITGEDW